MNCACEEMRQSIAGYVLGILDGPEKPKVEAHLAECKVCKEYCEQLTRERKMLKDYSDMLDADMDAMEMKVIEALNTSATKTLRSNSLWRNIMKSKVTRTAVAAAVIVCVMLGSYVLTGSFDGSSKVYAMSDLPELLYSAKTVYMKGFSYHPDNLNPGEMVTGEVEVLIDLENERWVRVKPNVMKDKNGTRVTMAESICDGSEYELYLDHEKETASYAKSSRYWRKRLLRQCSDTIIQVTCGDPEMIDLYKIVGSEEIDDQMYDIWELVIENKSDDSMAMNVKMQSWLSPTTGDIAQVIVWAKLDGKEWSKLGHITEFEIDLEVSDEDFAMVVPQGYELTNTLETAPENSVGGGVMCGTGKYYLQGHILFAMGDGSIVACWSSRNPKSDESQAELFAGLEFGGEMPKLPSVVEELKTYVNSQEIIYEGRHLAYTQKGGRFFEWGLYSAREPVERSLMKMLPYQFLYKTNGKKDNSCRMSMQSDMVIDNSDDFDEFVMGAMAEFSDDGEVSENVTYETVLELAEEIRTANN